MKVTRWREKEERASEGNQLGRDILKKLECEQCRSWAVVTRFFSLRYSGGDIWALVGEGSDKYLRSDLNCGWR